MRVLIQGQNSGKRNKGDKYTINSLNPLKEVKCLKIKINEIFKKLTLDLYEMSI